MNHPARFTLALGLIALLTACGIGDKSSSTKSGLDTRPGNPDCVAGKRPAAGADSVAIQQVFAGLSFDAPLAMVQPPGDSSHWVVIEKAGRAWLYANDTATTTRGTFIDLTATVDDQSEGGLLGIAFHPDYATNGYVFLSYTTSAGGPFSSVLSRFTANAGRTALDPASELVLMKIRQPYSNHNGGNIAFDKDGLLYFGLGDGGSGGDPENHGQDTRTLLGALLRVDVNVSSSDLGSGVRYKIPAGNPFGGTPVCLNGVCPDQAYAASAQRCAGTGCAEIFAWGLRNPWRWSFDRLTGDLWAGDVGQYKWEEIDLIQAGKNYGWGCYEGTHAYTDGPAKSATICPVNLTHVLPVAEYGHSLGSAITGGYVYRGAAIPALTGSYLFSDSGSGRLWVLPDPKSAAPVFTQLLNTGMPVVSFAEAHDGELYVLEYGGGVHKIVPGSGSATSAFPANLSDTGCAAPSNPKEGTSGMIPYEINAALWSDGAAKKRWLALPDDATIGVADDSDWTFPPGSILRKDFFLGGKIVETRLLAHHTDGDWAGYSYAWNAGETAATLVPDGRTDTIGGQAWTYPSGSDCLRCHTVAAGRNLGPESAQLNRDALDASGGATANQIERLSAIGMFATPQSASQSPVMPDPGDVSQPLEARAKAYLHTNCSHCHRPGGLGGGAADFRYATAFADMSICDRIPDNALGVTDARLFAPGDPARSVIALRMRDTGGNRMPPLATSVVDSQAVNLIEGWISVRSTCT